MRLAFNLKVTQYVDCTLCINVMFSFMQVLFYFCHYKKGHTLKNPLNVFPHGTYTLLSARSYRPWARLCEWETVTNRNTSNLNYDLRPLISINQSAAPHDKTWAGPGNNPAADPSRETLFLPFTSCSPATKATTELQLHSPLAPPLSELNTIDGNHENIFAVDKG